jgi:hypothetical protein
MFDFSHRKNCMSMGAKSNQLEFTTITLLPMTTNKLIHAIGEERIIISNDHI